VVLWMYSLLVGVVDLVVTQQAMNIAVVLVLVE
jgi:hypothetical protein